MPFFKLKVAINIQYFYNNRKELQKWLEKKKLTFW